MGRRREDTPAPVTHYRGEEVHPLVNRSSVELVSIEAIDVDVSVNPCRRSLEVSELAASIRDHGLLQPIVVRPDPARPGRYQLVAGHRRLAALKLLATDGLARWTHVPAVVRAEDGVDTYVLTLVENLQRDDLSPREEAEVLERLVRQRRWTTRQVAAAVKRSQAYISKRLRAYEDRSLRPLIMHGQIPRTVAEELLAVAPEQRSRVAKQAAAEHWDQRRARAEARGYTAPFHPRLRENVASLRELMAHATLSLGERELLHEFARFVLEALTTPEPGATA
jgi:ParB/RepB/Spo0J family partition protein